MEYGAGTQISGYNTAHYLSYHDSPAPVMPRQPPLDAPETLHHVMVRGIERTALFRDETDRADFVARLARLAEQGALTVSPGPCSRTTRICSSGRDSALWPAACGVSSRGTRGRSSAATNGWAISSRAGTSPSNGWYLTWYLVPATG